MTWSWSVFGFDVYVGLMNNEKGMIKNGISIVFLCVLFVLSACGVEHSQNILFDGKTFVLETDGQEYIKTAVVELPDFYL